MFTCTRCKRELDDGAFSPDRRRASGVQSRCKACCSEVERAKNASLPSVIRRNILRDLAARGLSRCISCEKDWPATTEFFHPHTGAKSGLQPRCKECLNAERRSDSARSRGREKVKTNYHRARRAKNAAAWRGRNPDILRAYTAVKVAIRAGRLKRLPCERCGSEPAEAHHHHGYDREHWLDVQWLCKQCHEDDHRLGSKIVNEA